MAQRPYAPDDARFDPAMLEFLRGDAGRALRASITQMPDPQRPSVADVARLREECPAEVVRVALVLAGIQAKGRAKFPELPYVWSPPEALEQATSSRVARHKAGRFAAALQAGGPIYDLCAGIGGDALSLADVAPVTAVDLSAARLACLRYNAEDQNPVPRFAIDTRAEDVADLIPKLPTDAWAHIDPARRSGGKRTPEYADMQPGPALLDALIRRTSGVAIKLSPAVDFDTLPPGHLELISDHGSVVQAVLWTGNLAFAGAAERTATVLAKGGAAWSFTAMPQAPMAHDLPAPSTGNSSDEGTPLFLYELDGSVTRAGLAGPLAAKYELFPITTDGGYAYSTQRDLAARLPCVVGFKVLGFFPYSEAKIAAELAKLVRQEKHEPVEVKCRGHLPGVDTDRLQRVWTKVSREATTVLIFRHRKEIHAAIARRL